MSTGPSPFARERIMSLSRAEFEASIAKLGPHTVSADGHPVFALKHGTVEIRYRAAAAKTLGGLLALPQAVVTLAFSDSIPAAEAAFIHRFDIAFQRGGG